MLRKGLFSVKNILEYLENSGQKYGHKMAVNDGRQSFSYHELIEVSQKIGSGISKFTEQRRPVVLLMEKSSVALAAMFGVLYAGCFYVNVHPQQPPERIQKIFEVLNPAIVIVNEATENLLKESGYCGTALHMKELLGGQVDNTRLKEIKLQSKETDLLYGIFTSGSTGVPKEIVVSHKAVIQFIEHFTSIFRISEDERIGNQAPFDFDVSVKDIYSAIMTGATLILISKELFATPPRLLGYLCDNKVSTLIWAVSALSLISSLKGLEYKIPYTVKKVMFSGEVMPVKQLQKWQKAFPEATFVNLYGPSEITCNCTYYQIDKEFKEGEKIPIGTAFPGREVFLLDEDQKEIFKPQEMGEICVAGESLSEGYYHNPEQTEKSFILYPASGKNRKRTYRTGDMGYYGEDGKLYFAGRKDFQIKHMGHRIELEEIEAALTNIGGISRSCCVFDYSKNRIVAFYTGDADSGDVRRRLKTIIPVYMIPNKLVKVEHIPLNKNGKMDRKYFMQLIGGDRK